MSEKIRTLTVVSKYNAQAVEYLEQLLAEAKSGDIVEICCITKLRDGMYSHCWTGCEDLYQLVGYLERVKHLQLRRMDV